MNIETEFPAESGASLQAHWCIDDLDPIRVSKRGLNY
jgi:hypothetical protein